MITIKVGGKPLYIPKDTSIVLEQNNNIFQDNITEDIVWTFTIPARPNSTILGEVQFNYVNKYKRYDCELSFNGIPFSIGKLYIQSATDEQSLECGIVANSFGVGFGEKKLRENDYGSDIVISQSEANHQAAWKTFLEGSLNANSIYKFFLFCCERFYQDNEDYGHHNNQKSGLVGWDPGDKGYYQFVNRLFFNANNEAYNNAETVRQGVRLFNHSNQGKMNGYCFAPALRLDWLVKKVLGNAGLQAKGTFFTNELIKKFFSQSLCAMDGDVFQYGTYTWLSVNGNINTYEETITDCQPFRIDADNNTHTCFSHIKGVSFGFRLLLPIEELVHVTENSNVWIGTNEGSYQFQASGYDEVYAIAVRAAGASLPNIRMITSTKEADGSKAFKYGKMPTFNELKARADISSDDWRYVELTGNGNCRAYYWVGPIPASTSSFQFYTDTNSILIQLSRSRNKNVFFSGDLGGYVEGNVVPGWKPSWGVTTHLFLQLVKCKIYNTSRNQAPTYSLTTGTGDINVSSQGQIEAITDYEIESTLAIDTTDTPLNIFSNVLRWRDHVPNLSNGEFLTRICQIFGLNLFVNPLSKEIQLSFFSDTLKGDSFDISQWITHSERMEYKPKSYKVNIKPALNESSVSENNITEPVTSKDELPGAFINKNKHAFVANENAYRRSTKQENTSRFEWDKAGGNDARLIAGSSDPEETEEVTIEAMVPNMMMADERVSNTNRKYLCEIPLSGCSPLMDENFTGEFDLVLQQYRGKRLLSMTGGTVTSAYIEDANPTCYNESGEVVEDSCTLAADGDNSIGRMWLKELYDFKGRSEAFRFTASLPGWAFYKVYNLLKPQDGAPQNQVRWIYVQNNRYLPTKISYELGVNDKVLTTIECVRMHVE